MDISKLYAELRSEGYTDEQALCKLKSDIIKAANDAAIVYEKEQKRKAKEEQKKVEMQETKDEICKLMYKYYTLKGLSNRSSKEMAEDAIGLLDFVFDHPAYKLFDFF